MVIDLDMGIDIVGMPTVRETDGLAMSSRNRRLSPPDREAAAVVAKALRAMAARATGVDGDDVSATALETLGREILEAEPRARIEYLRVVDPLTLEAPADVRRGAHGLAAVWFGEVRLIDNMRLV